MTCSDYLRVELGPPAVFPKFIIDPDVMLTPLLDEERDRMRKLRPRLRIMPTPTP